MAADARYFTEVLGGRLVFAVQAMGVRVAMIELSGAPPQVLLTDHLDGGSRDLRLPGGEP